VGELSEIAILGAGNGGCAAAADLSLRGFRVRLFNRSPERLEPIRRQGGVELVGVAGNGLAKLRVVTSDLAEAVRGADLIVVTMPTSALEYLGSRLAPLLTESQVVLLNPGHMGGALFLVAEIRRLRPGFRPRLCETTTLTYACRLEGPATVRVYRVATNLLFAALPGRLVDELYEVVRAAFPEINKVANVLETGLQDLNAIEHPAQMVCNAGWVEHTQGDFFFYYEGTTPGVSRVIEEVDRERMSLAAALGVPTLSFVDYFAQAGYTTPEAAATGSVFEAMQASEANRWIKGPRNLEHRYLSEDVGWGLVPWIELAGLAGVEVPMMRALTVVASGLNGVNYLERGLTLDRMGLSGTASSSDLLELVMEGVV
jgi:opine dehydrogenase